MFPKVTEAQRQPGKKFKTSWIVEVINAVWKWS